MQKPYYAVIFTSTQTENLKGYAEMSEALVQLAKTQNGFLGIESARDTIGITVSYWESLEAIANWKQHIAHLKAQEKGKNLWYSHYTVRICKVEREYDSTEQTK